MSEPQLNSYLPHGTKIMSYQWGVTRRCDQGLIGTCTLAHVDAQNRRAEIGFALRRDHWGRGYTSEAARTVLRLAFEQLELHRVEADVDPRNEASIRLLESLGFQRLKDRCLEVLRPIHIREGSPPAEAGKICSVPFSQHRWGVISRRLAIDLYLGFCCVPLSAMARSSIASDLRRIGIGPPHAHSS